MSSKFKI